MNLLNAFGRILSSVGKQFLREGLRNLEEKNRSGSRGSSRSRGGSGKSGRGQSKARSSAPAGKRNKIRRGAGVGLPGPNENAVEFDVERFGLPNFEYSPDDDGQPDPGEVAWTWVPFEENDGRGKDRPVLVLAAYGDYVVFGQLTSKDHDLDAEQEAYWGRYWFDIGSGEWDSRGRESEIRLDRLLIVHKNQVRREGGRLDREIFTAVVRALKEFHSK